MESVSQADDQLSESHSEPSTEDAAVVTQKRGKTDFRERFKKFAELFAEIGENEKLFPKRCTACGRVYHSFPDFMRSTSPVRHGLEDCSEVMCEPYTMQYQNCWCGTTLILTLTGETYPLLQELWESLRKEALETGKPLHQVVSDFREQCERQILAREKARSQALQPSSREVEGVRLPRQQSGTGATGLGGLLRRIKNRLTR